MFWDRVKLPLIQHVHWCVDRYTQPPADLWDWYDAYLEDPEVCNAACPIPAHSHPILLFVGLNYDAISITHQNILKT
jgi:hypothetical protein